MKELILASTSPRRKEILEKSGLSFRIVPSDYEEDMTLDMPPKELARYLGEGKAQAVAKQYPDAIVIGADTLVSYNGEVLGKPHTAENAKMMLQKLSGQTHSLITGFSLVHHASRNVVSDAIESKVTIKELTDSEIEHYVASGEPLDKAGAYAIQELGAVLVEKIEGDFFTIMGLPLFRICQELKQFGIEVL